MDAFRAQHPFDTDTFVERVGQGRYRAHITDRWGNLVGTPNGGYQLSVCLRALLGEVDFPDPLVLSAYLLRPAEVGDAEIAVELVRSGRRLATAEARLFQAGKERVRMIATFCDLAAADGHTAILDEAPALPDPDTASDPLAEVSVPGATIGERIEYRMPELPGWWRGSPSGDASAEFWLRFREPRDPDLLSLPLLVDAGPPVVLELGAAASSTLEITVHLRHRPAPGFLACRFKTRYLVDGFHEEDCELWDSRGRLVAQSRQMAVAIPRPDAQPAI